MNTTAKEFDAKYFDNTRWDEALDAIDNGFYDLQWDYSMENEPNECYCIIGEEPEIDGFFSIYDLTSTDNFRYRIWKAQSNRNDLVKVKKESLQTFKKIIDRQKAEISLFTSEISPLWETDGNKKSGNLFSKLMDELNNMEKEVSK